jgi:hypothetical protein
MSGAVIDYYKRLYAAQKAPGANKHTRLALIVAERGISETELQEFRGKRGNVFDYYAFAERYRVSINWLLDGDLRGLRETVTSCPARSQGNLKEATERAKLERQIFAHLLAKLSPRAYAIALEEIRKAMAGKP